MTAPAGEHLLERTLTRGLGDGAEIVVTRSWRCTFTPSQSGLVVAGRQQFAEVSAPPALAALAELERSRTTDTLFPMALDRTGLIRPGTGTANGPELARAIDTAQSLLIGLDAQQLHDASAFVRALGQRSAAAISRMPSDLFFPAPGTNTTTREVALPSGEAGSVTVIASAHSDPASGLLTASSRVIVTRMEASARLASERWTLRMI